MSQEALQNQAARVRNSGVLGRSHGLLRLFDYLAEPAREGRALSEADVAAEVFGRRPEAGEDASVRVYVHRLRKKLEDFYGGAGRDEPHRLMIPVGAYRLDVVDAVEAPAAPPQRHPDRRWLWAAAVVLVLALNAGVWLFLRQGGPDREIARAAAQPLWAGLGRDRPVLVVVGDYYIFGDTEHGERPVRMVRDFDINSPADLDAFLMENPQFQGRYVDLDTYYTPVGATLALRELMPLVVQAAGGPDRIRVTTASQLTPQMMKTSDVVYVGYLSALRLLQEPAFVRSRWRIGDTYDELVDRRSGQIYVSGAGQAPGNRANRDYGYLGAYQGSAGNRFIIIAGARDIGVMQTAELAADTVTLRGLDGPAIDALYTVEGVGRTNLSAAPVK